MKMANNTLEAVKKYLYLQLNPFYSSREIDLFVQLGMQHLLGISKEKYLMNPGQLLNESELLKIVYYSKDLRKYKPLQYILGHTEFYGLPINVSPAVLIPRPETEELVEWMLGSIKDKLEVMRILDIGTGSGCIPIALKKEVPKADVWACDISNEALDVARENANLNGVEVAFFNWDIFTEIPIKASKKWNVIISNPPYVLESDKAEMQAAVLDYEPHQALFIPDQDPLLFYRRIGELAKSMLCDKGLLFFEIHEKYADQTLELLKIIGYEQVELRNDLSGKPRMIMAQVAD
ncbi:MAG: peptide chain release factor N(5)-glutamine methyltransferase [Flavobacteriales bacterium]|nr:peptide chain release factor N(5)-glutamine methyltransferase [Flavobacteriales bacterium]